MDPRLTVVMLNFRRPSNVRQFVAAYAAMTDVVAAVTVVNCNPATTVDFPDHPAITTMTFSADPGLTVRFAAGALARTEAVLHVDDDILLPPETVTGLWRAWQADTSRLYGLFGRNPAEDGSYTTVTAHGPCEALLTRAVLGSRSLCGRAAEYTQQMTEALGGEPWGNGEDLVLGYTALRMSGRLNRALDLPYTDIGDSDAHAISVRYTGHLAHRAEVVRWCRRTLLDNQVPRE